ncbi:MAG: hypothetical protein P8L39_05155 [Halioglobus sp.]|nr:hypothetical protein [Halioglobus sp.]
MDALPLESSGVIGELQSEVRRMKKAHKVSVPIQQQETQSEALSKFFLDPSAMAGVTVTMLMDKQGVLGDDFDINGLVRVLERQVKKTLSADRLEESQRMLAAEAQTLDSLFNSLVRLGINNVSENIDAFESLVKLALRAQSQCRATLEALSEIKNPKLANVLGQANFASGHQQVINQVKAEAREGIESEPNELLGGEKYERMDTRTPREAGTTYSTVEAVGAVDRPDKQ